jgi:hypothetical protein
VWVASEFSEAFYSIILDPETPKNNLKNLVLVHDGDFYYVAGTFNQRGIGREVYTFARAKALPRDKKFSTGPGFFEDLSATAIAARAAPRNSTHTRTTTTTAPASPKQTERHETTIQGREPIVEGI